MPLAGCRSAPAATNPAPQPPDGEVWLTAQQVRDAKVAGRAGRHSTSVGNEIVTSGKVTFDDLRVAHIFSPVTGRVTQILAEPGQRVKKGARAGDHRVARRRQRLRRSRQGAGRSDRRRARLPAPEGALRGARRLADATTRRPQDNYGKAKAELERAQQKARLLPRGGGADAVTQEFTLRAPIEGEVIARNVNPGVEVQGQYSGGTAVELFTIGELDRVWVLADVFEMDLARVQEGRAGQRSRWSPTPTRSSTGKVDWISDALDPTTRTARVRCAIANPDRQLKPEMYATVPISVAEREGAGACRAPRCCASAIRRSSSSRPARRPTGASKFERRPVAVDEDEGGDYLPIAHGARARRAGRHLGRASCSPECSRSAR